MKYLKFFENINDINYPEYGPQLGDWVLITACGRPDVDEFTTTHPGQVVTIKPTFVFKDVSSHTHIYIVVWENVPYEIRLNFEEHSNGGTRQIHINGFENDTSYKREINLFFKYWSKNKEDVEEAIVAGKFGI